ncbi:MAG: ImmA/IrrE family metallo-endopeptidase [Elusimicrobia bacterium]|nr:ImmA/IrrE family metallo-endopeptidase [Candidatus Liberimonas magnetica]
MQVVIKSKLMRWAIERSGLSPDKLLKRFPKISAWESGKSQPTLKQIESFAKATYTPFGYFFLSEPPIERMPIPDFRSASIGQNKSPSPNLLDIIYICQQRQDWYRDFARSSKEESLTFAGSASINDGIEKTAAKIRHTLGFDLEERRKMHTWTEALRNFIEHADNAGVLVMCSSVVLNNNHRHLDPYEFGGFAIADDIAPLVFINGSDMKARQMFTLAHELAHVWLGQTAVSDAQITHIPENDVENWCNKVAAELLVPMAVFEKEYKKDNELVIEMNRLARQFKVSTLVILRRIYDSGGVSKQRFWSEYNKELERLQDIPRSKGGDFYLSQAARVSKRFACALVASTLEGQTLYRDAFRLLGFSKQATFHDFGVKLGVI